MPMLCALFMLTMLLPALMGAKVYEDVSRGSEENFARRTAVAYLANQLHRADVPGGIALSTFGGGDALKISTEEGYSTYIYCHGGFLRELYAADDVDFSPEDGTALVECGELDIELETGTIILNICGGRLAFTPQCGCREETP